MTKVLVVYDSLTGNTEQMAKAVGEGVKNAGIEVEIKKVTRVELADLEAADAIILGSPTHFGAMSENMKRLITKSHAIRKKLVDKLGAAFTSSTSVAGGNETTLLSMLQAMLIHGMLVLSDPIEPGYEHYGVASIGKPQHEDLEACRRLGERVAKLAAKRRE